MNKSNKTISMKLLLIFVILFSAHAQVDNILNEDKFYSCNEKCYIIVNKLNDLGISFDTNDARKLKSICNLYLKNVFNTKIEIIDKSEIDTVKKCNAKLIVISIEGYSTQSSKIGQNVGIINNEFYIFNNANNKEADKKVEVTASGEPLWGEAIVFRSSFKESLKMFIEKIKPNKFRIKPIIKEN